MRPFSVPVAFLDLFERVIEVFEVSERMFERVIARVIARMDTPSAEWRRRKMPKSANVPSPQIMVTTNWLQPELSRS